MLVQVHAGSVYGLSYLLDLFLIHVLLAVHGGSVYRPSYLLDLFLVHVLLAVHAGAVYDESTAGTAPECCGMGAALCRVLAPPTAAQEVFRLLEYCLSEEEKEISGNISFYEKSI